MCDGSVRCQLTEQPQPIAFKYVSEILLCHLRSYSLEIGFLERFLCITASTVKFVGPKEPSILKAMKSAFRELVLNLIVRIYLFSAICGTNCDFLLNNTARDALLLVWHITFLVKESFSQTIHDQGRACDTQRN